MPLPRRAEPSLPQAARMTLASDELFRAIARMTPEELIRWYQAEYVRHPERLEIIEALIGCRSAMITSRR
jgi:hypothetical protein